MNAKAEHRARKRVQTERMALAHNNNFETATVTHDISTKGVALTYLGDGNVKHPPALDVGMEATILIDEMEPLVGRVVRTTENGVAIEFLDLDPFEEDRLIAEIMDSADRFPFDD